MAKIRKEAVERVIPNTFAPNIKSKMLSYANLFQGLQYGFINEDKVPQKYLDKVLELYPPPKEIIF